MRHTAIIIILCALLVFQFLQKLDMQQEITVLNDMLLDVSGRLDKQDSFIPTL